jgi:hypothetical protein
MQTGQMEAKKSHIKAKKKAEMYIKGETNYSLADVVLKNVVIKLD